MILWFLYILIDAYFNYNLIEKQKKEPNYISLTLTRGIVFVITGAIFDLQQVDFLPWLLYCTCSFWLIFDLTLNLLRKKSPFYMGADPEESSSRIDSWGRKHKVLYWTLKTLAIPTVILSILRLI